MKITIILIAICIGIFILMGNLTLHNQTEMFEKYGFSSENLSKGNFWVLVTSLFLHGSLTHLVFNMVALFFFGRMVERELRPKRFLSIFLLGGIAGNLLSLLFYPGGEVFIGASGAIFAIIGIGMLIDPFEMSFYPYLVPVPLALVGVAYTLYTIFAFIFGGDPNVAYTAHLGGLLVGILLGLRRASKKGIISIIILFAILLAIPALFDFLGMLDYSQLLGMLF